MEIIIFLIGSFKAGGIFMYAILAVLAIGTAIIIERLLSLFYRNRGDGKILWKKVKNLVGKGQLKEALELCDGTGTYLSHVLASGIQKRIQSTSEKEIQGAFEETLLEIQPYLEKRIHYLYALSNVSTLLGLLGTVTGLIQSFTAVSASDPAQKSVLLASGISLALNNTAFGLLIAIILMLSYSFMQSKSATLEDEIDEYSLKLLHLLTESNPKSS
ncbi:MAG: MotA/TolQ/ExbB proton channel family protein [Nitrospirae bacterium]|nr:MotA/TolQ/ExbB proton channel family protein [Nitrospirota bacterium]MBI3595468.1 MotA/TolQ/ExbB proton channel family protein [Nitrospirota bacterium]